jgi:predicted O-linked N-acetylglucosamine transferase (SPINDLY family)
VSNPTSIDEMRRDALQSAQAGNFPRAEELYRRILVAKPDDADILRELGEVLAATNRPRDAAAALRRAVALRPDFADAFLCLGLILRKIGEIDAAVAAIRRATEIQPANGEAFFQLADVLSAAGRPDEAIAAFRQTLELRPDHIPAWMNLGTTLRNLGRNPEGLECYDSALAIEPDNQMAHSNRLYLLQFHPDYSLEMIYREHDKWNVKFAMPLMPRDKSYPNNPDPDRRLRIGYVSPDFRNHCQSLFTIPLFSHHDHQQFEIVCYAHIPKPDQQTDRLRKLADIWRNTVGLGDAALADMIRADKIDILVDLTMHMAGGRPMLFARKPAPVQIAWLAYPGTTGLTAIDYRLTDPYLDPVGQNNEYYSEKSIRLPETFWCYDPLANEPSVNELPALKNGHITFGCLNNFAKMNAGQLKMWRRVLETVPNSRMILLAPQGESRSGVIRELAVDPSRIDFVDLRPRAQYLQIYHQIDLGLDTFPYNGHTTSLDSLWMGVPVISRCGTRPISRAGLTQCANLGLTDELLANSEDEFVDRAVKLSGNLGRLRELRSTLRCRLEKSPLMDAARFARDIVAVYRDIWARWCNSPRS